MTSATIYDDLNNIDLGERVLKLQQQNDKLHNHILSLEKDVQKLCNELVEMKKVEENLKRNISELYKTAKNEIDRKDRMISELRRELDDVLFRRRSHQMNVSNNVSNNTSDVANSSQINYEDNKTIKRDRADEQLDYEKNFKRVKREFSESDDVHNDTKNLNCNNNIKQEIFELSQIENGNKSRSSTTSIHERYDQREERRSKQYHGSRSKSREHDPRHDHNRRDSNNRNNYKRSKSRDSKRSKSRDSKRSRSIDSKRSRTRSKEREVSCKQSKSRNKDYRKDFQRSDSKEKDLRTKLNRNFDRIFNSVRRHSESSDKKSSTSSNKSSSKSKSEHQDSKDQKEHQIKTDQKKDGDKNVNIPNTKVKEESLHINNSSKLATDTTKLTNKTAEKDYKHTTNGLDNPPVLLLNNKENEKTQSQDDKAVIIQSNVMKDEGAVEKCQLDQTKDIQQPCIKVDSVKLEKSPNTTIKLNARRRRCVIKIVN